LDLTPLVENAKKSVFFTSPNLERDLSAFFEEWADEVRALAKKIVSEKIRRIYWVGSGNSWCNLYSGHYILNRYCNIPSEYYQAYEFMWQDPRGLDSDAIVILASFSGMTEDTVAALRFAKEKGAQTVAIVSKKDSLMGREGDIVIDYRSNALFIVPLAAVCLLSLEIVRLQGADVQKTIDQLMAMPPLLGKLYRESEERSRELAVQYKDSKLLYLLSGGPLFALGYKFCLTVFMENMRVHGSFIDTPEFRHGPAEMLEREKPVMVFLLGTDDSREMSERVMKTGQENGASIITFDAAEYGDVDPLLAPFVLMVPLQWFAVYSALLRGIADLDQRVLMGRGKMAKGDQVTWP